MVRSGHWVFTSKGGGREDSFWTRGGRAGLSRGIGLVGRAGSLPLLGLAAGLLPPFRPLVRSGRNSIRLGLGSSEILDRPASEEGETSGPRLKKEDPELGLKNRFINQITHMSAQADNLMMGGTKPAAFSW